MDERCEMSGADIRYVPPRFVRTFASAGDVPPDTLVVGVPARVTRELP